MSLEKAFLDMLSPNWYTNKDNPYEVVGEYSPYSTQSTIGDRVFAYYIDNNEDQKQCLTYADAMQDLRDKWGYDIDGQRYLDNSFLYKAYGTITEKNGNGCTLDIDDTGALPLRVVDNDIHVLSEQEALAFDEAEQEEEEDQAQDLSPDADTETEYDRLQAMFFFDETEQSEDKEHEIFFRTEEEEDAALREFTWDKSFDKPKRRHYPKKEPSSFRSNRHHSHKNNTFSAKQKSRSFAAKNRDNKEEEVFETPPEEYLDNDTLDPYADQEMEDTPEQIEPIIDDVQDSSETIDDDADADKSEETEIDIGM